MKKYLATISILIKDRQTNAGKMQDLLTNNGHIIMARMGVNVQRACVSNCTGLLCLAVEGTNKQIKELTKKLNGLYGITAAANIMTK